MTLNASSNPHSGIKDGEGKVGTDYTVEGKTTCPTCLNGMLEAMRRKGRTHGYT